MSKLLFSRASVLSLAGLFLLSIALIGCGKDTPAPAKTPTANTGGPATAPGGGGDGGGEVAAGAAEGVPGTATISGKVTFKGTAPKNARIEIPAAHGECQKQHPDPLFEQAYVVGDDGGFQWVFVYVLKGDGVIGKKWAIPAAPVVLDQHGCMYEPHVFGVMAGQEILVKNSDPVMHNIHAQPQKSAEFNESQNPGAPAMKQILKKAEVFVSIKCDVHNWMHACAGVVTHPYYAVTDAKGSYSIDKLPPGKYTIRAKHEKIEKPIEKEIEVKADGKVTLDFEFTK